MAIPKSRYKDVSFYTGFSYLIPIATGKVDATVTWNGFENEYNINATIPLPATVIAKPPYVKFYIDYIGKTRDSMSDIALYAGVSGDNIRIYKQYPSYLPFSVRYVIYDRPIQ